MLLLSKIIIKYIHLNIFSSFPVFQNIETEKMKHMYKDTIILRGLSHFDGLVFHIKMKSLNI